MTSSLTVQPLHPTFAAEVSGLDFSTQVDPKTYSEIRKVIDRYGVVVFRDTGLDDERHIAFSRLFGELDDVEPYQQAGRVNRLKHKELFDVGNIDPTTGEVGEMTQASVVASRGNSLFHVDSSFNARRAGHSLLLAHELPPPGTGGETEYSDTRTAYDDLSPDMKDRLEPLIAYHSLFHSRKVAMPDYFKGLDPEKYPMSKHKLVQEHEASGRTNLYMAAHIHHLEGLPKEESAALLKELTDHIYKHQYRCKIEWKQPGDMIIWDNTCVAHRATGGSFEGKYRRDMRRTTVHDMSSTCYGLNGVSTWRVGLP